MKTFIELIAALRCYIRMFGFPIDESTKSLCENEILMRNYSKPEYILNKKTFVQDYHAMRWAAMSGIVPILWLPSCYNLAYYMENY